MTLLVCIADPTLRLLVVDYLRQEGIEVIPSPNASDTLEQLNRTHIDLALVDGDVPDMAEYQLLKEIRNYGYNLPLVVLSERNSREDMIEAYHAGCDDYILKPCTMDIVLCKLLALNRLYHGEQTQNETSFQLGDIVFDSVKQVLISNNQEQPVRLSTKENELLLMLCRNRNQVVDRSLILKQIWKNDDCFSSRSLSVYVHHLRNTLNDLKCNAKIIAAHGKGYKIVEQAEA